MEIEEGQTIQWTKEKGQTRIMIYKKQKYKHKCKNK
jgi:hypothetical protein